MDEFLRTLLAARRLTPVEAGQVWRDEPGIYAIFVDAPGSMPAPFSSELQRRGTDLIYIGKADTSLRQRAYEEELRHRRAATFFRTLGAVLGHLPDHGSLVGKANQNNYRFSKQATDQIIAWIDSHITAAAVTMPVADIVRIEPLLIAHATPLLNIQGNPSALAELKAVRDHCRAIARGEARS
jgi:hypothetical protein